MTRNATTNYRYQEAMPQRVRDVLGRLKVAIHQNIYDADFEYGSQPLRWEAVTTGSGTVTTVPQQGGIRMSVTSSAGDIAMRQSRPYHRYQPGKTMFMATGCQMGGPVSGNSQRVGFFDDTNGVFFEQSVSTTANPQGMYVVVRSDVGGSIQETRVGMDGWNGDSVLAKTLDFTRIQMFWIEFAWYGAGATRFGVWIDGEPVILHQIGWGNYFNTIQNGGQITPWARTGNLPVRYEVRNSGSASAPTSMYHYGVSVIVEGQADPQRGFTYSYGMNPIAPTRSVGTSTAVTRYPVLSIRSRALGTLEWGNILGLASTSPNFSASTTSTSSFSGTISSTNVPVTGTLNGTTFTLVTGTPSIGQQFSGQGIVPGTYIISGSGTSWTLSQPQVAVPTTTTFTLTTTTLTVSGSVTGTIAKFQALTGFGLVNGTYIIATNSDNATFTGTGGTGTYALSTPQPNIASTTSTAISGAYNSVTITGPLTANQFQGRYIYFAGVGTSGTPAIGRITTNTTTVIYFADPLTNGTVSGTFGTATLASASTSTGTSGAYQITPSGSQTGTFAVGQALSGTGGIAAGTYITSINGGVLGLNKALTGNNPTLLVAVQGYAIGLANRGQLLPKRLMAVQTAATVNCVIEIIASTTGNPVALTGASWVPTADIGSPNSFAERDVTATALTGGEVVFAFVLSAGAGVQDIDFTYFFPLFNNVKGSQLDTLTVAVSTAANVTAQVGAHLICQEAMS